MKIRTNLLIIVTIWIFCLAVSTVARASSFNKFDLYGFSWIGNHLHEGSEDGDPAIGMIKLDGSNFQVTFEEGEDIKLITGSAWFGIGSENDKYYNFVSQYDLPSLGWIRFNQGVPEANCFSAGDCHAVRWNKKPGSVNELEGYLSGWAEVEIGLDGTGLPYSEEVWVHFKSPPDPNNYTCSDSENNYFVCTNDSKEIYGFAWSSGINSTSVNDNSGFGWIEFSKNSIDVITSGERFCSVISSPSEVSCKDREVTFNASYSQMINPVVAPENYWWKCDNEKLDYDDKGVIDINWDKKCTYAEEGTFTPELIIRDETVGDINCNSTTINVVNEESCSIEVRKSGEGGYGPEVTIYSPNEIEARVIKQCIDGGEDIEWTVDNGDIVSSGSSFLVATFNKDEGGSISAKITLNKGEVDEKVINCQEGVVNVKARVKWGQL